MLWLKRAIVFWHVRPSIANVLKHTLVVDLHREIIWRLMVLKYSWFIRIWIEYRLILVFPQGQSHLLGRLDPSLSISSQQRWWGWEAVLTTIIPGTTTLSGAERVLKPFLLLSSPIHYYKILWFFLHLDSQSIIIY